VTIDRLPLPYAFEALAPTISAATLHEHYDKHHASYVEKTRKLAVEHDCADMDLHSIILKAARDKSMKSLFNNAAQVWNHDFYWHSLQDNGPCEMPNALAMAIDEAFGSRAKFRSLFLEKAASHFGSGWAWLIIRDRELEILTTPNGDTPAVDGAYPLITVDLWEHAYYLDYQHDRKAHLEAVFDRLLNWNLADALLATYQAASSEGNSALKRDIPSDLIWNEMATQAA
jgi:Fe-Mn family superoxide dismutase